ncbi:MAG: PASTA domain-containing protein, partial [Rhodobiaceae bacterium]|nr:PASTA domain-containing protein [Rhodobiaceae bacterium]
PTASEDPQFLVLQGAGDFEAPLCEFTEDEAIRMAGGKPEILSESELDKRFQARSTAIAGVTQPLTGKPVTALYKLNPDYLVERRHFELEDDLVLSDSGMVSVAVEVKDWSGAPLPSADVTITAGDATDVGVSEGEYPLAKGDLVKAEAALTVDGEAHKGRSESRFFDPAEDSGGITLSVDVPVFDTGNLTVTGAFKPDAAAAALGGIAGGTAHANIVRGQPISVSGPDFVIYNSQPVAASNGFTLTALLTAPDGKVSFLTPKCATASGIHDACTVRRDLTKGARLALEPIVVGPFSTRPQLLRIAVTDWSGAPIATDRVEVTIADKPAQRDFDSFFGDVSFSGRNEKLAVKARYTTLDGREIEAEETLAIDAVGDPLDPVQPDALTLRLPVYPSGRFRVVGNLRLEASAGQPDGTPATVTVTPASGVADPWNAVVGERMQFDLSGDVEPGEAVAIAGEARFDGADYKGDASGTAPQLGPANAPAILDIGDLVLRTAAPPDASDETATEPQPDEPDEPEQPPAGIAVPPLAGQTIDQATGTLAALGLAISPEALTGDPQGAAPSTVVLQDPAAGERLPEGGTVAVYYYPEASASVAEAPPPPETPPAVEPEPDTGQPAEEPAQDETADEAPADESPAPPPAVAVAPAPAGAPVSYPGGWLGDLRLTDIDFNVKGIRFKCAAFDPCVSLWSDVTYNMIAKSIAKDRAEREREVANMTPGEKLADALDFGGAIADGMGNAIMAAVAIGGIIGFDMAFDGIPAGFILTETETGIAFSLPQLGQKGSQIPEFLPTTQQDGGGLQLDYSVTENGATVELSGTIHPSATAEGHLDLSLTVRISKPGEGNGRVDLSGTFEPGTPSKEAIVEVTKAQFKQRFEKPNGRILMPIKEMTEKLDKLMKADDKSD